MKRVKLEDIRVGERYWWNDPDDRDTGFVEVDSIDGETVVCNRYGAVVRARPQDLEILCELEEIKSDNGNNNGGYYGDQPWMYTMLGMSKDKFRRLVYEELVEGVATEYADVIAERIADDVAQDICDTADHKNWNDCDARLGIGRVLLKAVGGDA